jgi:hypothetical protein
MPAPVPVHERFSDEIKQLTIKLFNEGWTHAEIGEYYYEPERTIAKLCKHLGLSRSRSEAGALRMRSKLDNEETIRYIRENRDKHSIGELALMFDSSVASVQRLCVKYDIVFDGGVLRERLNSKLVGAWSEEMRFEASVRARNVSDEVRMRISERSRKARLAKNGACDE